MRVAIVGGGIGGLTTALCFAGRGHQVQLFERASTLSEVGAGIQLSPNAMQVLRALEIEPSVEFVAHKPKAWQLRDGVTGRQIFKVAMQPAARKLWGADYQVCHRADLITVLKSALARATNVELQLGAEITSLDALARFDLIVVADGAHSRLRSEIIDTSAPRYTGNLAWRLVMPTSRVPEYLRPDDTACVWAGEGRHAVTYYLRGKELINFVGIVERPDLEQARERDSWSWQAPKAQLEEDFLNWHPTINALVQAADKTVGHWALFDRPPLKAWSSNKAVLLGDSAHAMLPTMAQGAAMAIEDAWVLAECVAPDDLASNLKNYEKRRAARVAKVQRQALENARTWHQKPGLAREVNWGAMGLATRLKPSILMDRLDWIYGVNVVAPRR